MADPGPLTGPVLILVGGALPPDVVARFPIVSAAAARQQMGFAAALASEFNGRVVCLSYLPVGSGSAPRPWTVETDDGIEVRIIPRSRSALGTLAYFARMLREALRLRRVASCVVCYNALVWTTPWAFLLSQLSGSAMILMLADLDPFGVGTFRRRVESLIERLMLRLSKRFMVFSAETQSLLPNGAKSEVFSGIADEPALSQPSPVYGDSVRFVYAGSLAPHAGVTQFVEAAAIVASSGTSSEFHVFGRGTLTVDIPRALDGKLAVHGFVSDEELDTFLGKDCVGVNPRPLVALSLHNAPYKLIYYLSRGILSITTETSGVQDDLLGVCVVAGDSPKSLAEAMQLVLKMTPAERDKRARNGRSVISRQRSRRAFGETVRRLLEDQPRSAR